jgi:hypothetical protein
MKHMQMLMFIFMPTHAKISSVNLYQYLIGLYIFIFNIQLH